MKLCRDCKYCNAIGDYRDIPICMNPKLPVPISLVTGNTLDKFCMAERSYGLCGPIGAMFEPTQEYAEYLRDVKIDDRRDHGQHDTYEGCAVDDFERESGGAP